jgi:hypothetical protein
LAFEIFIFFNLNNYFEKKQKVNLLTIIFI